jgi:hypothetical protein
MEIGHRTTLTIKRPKAWLDSPLDWPRRTCAMNALVAGGAFAAIVQFLVTRDKSGAPQFSNMVGCLLVAVAFWGICALCFAMAKSYSVTFDGQLRRVEVVTTGLFRTKHHTIPFATVRSLRAEPIGTTDEQTVALYLELSDRKLVPLTPANIRPATAVAVSEELAALTGLSVPDRVGEARGAATSGSPPPSTPRSVETLELYGANWEQSEKRIAINLALFSNGVVL